MSATYTTQWQQIAQIAKGLEVYRGNVQTAWPTQEATDVSATDQGAPRAASKIAGIAAFRAAQAGAMSSGIIQGQCNGIVLELGRIIKANEAQSANDNVSLVLARERRYMIDNPDSLAPPSRATSQQFVNPTSATTPAPGYPAVVGTGTIYQLLVDEDGFPLESRLPDTITYVCDGDRQSGTFVGQETFTFRGLPLDDAIDLYAANKGSGVNVPGVASISADTSQKLGIGNASFSVVNGTPSSLTSIDSWDVVIGTISMFQVDQTNYYVAANLEGTTPGSLSVTPTAGLTAAWRQQFAASNTSLSKTQPVFVQCAFNAQIATATGTLTMKLGSQSVSVTVDGLAGWQILKLPLDKNLYFKNYDVDLAEVRFTFAATNGNALKVDDLRVGYWTPVGGIFYASLGGATPWLLRDSGTFAYTAGTPTTGIPGRIQRVFARGYSAELPTALPSVNPAPGAPTAAGPGGGAGNVDNGAHEYVAAVQSPTASGGIVGFVSVISNVITIVDKTVNGKITVTMPTLSGLTGYTMVLFRSKAGAPGVWYQQGTGYTSGQVVTDNTADAGLGAQPVFLSAATQPQDA